jgi:hypothetical protein
MTHKGTNSRMGISKVEERQEAQQIETSSPIQVKYLRVSAVGNSSVDCQFAICNLQFAICNLQFAICNLQFAICNGQVFYRAGRESFYISFLFPASAGERLGRQIR